MAFRSELDGSAYRGHCLGWAALLSGAFVAALCGLASLLG